jgi:hypothetical protein
MAHGGAYRAVALAALEEQGREFSEVVVGGRGIASRYRAVSSYGNLPKRGGGALRELRLSPILRSSHSVSCMFIGIESSALYRSPSSTLDTNRRIDIARCRRNGRPGATLYLRFEFARASTRRVASSLEACLPNRWFTAFRARTGSNRPVRVRIVIHGKVEGVLELAPRASASFPTRLRGSTRIDREPVNPLGEMRSWVKTDLLPYPKLGYGRRMWWQSTG